MKNKKILKVLGATALLGATTLSLASCSVTDTIKGWFNDDPTEVTPTPDISEPIVDGEEIANGELLESMPSKICFTNASSRVSTGNTVTFKATIEPSYATDKTISWSLAWNGSSSENVNDYISMTNTGDTVTLQCLKGFNTQILLTAKTSKGLKATATLDSLRKPNKLYFATAGQEDEQNINMYYSQSRAINLMDNQDYYSSDDSDGSEAFTDYLNFGYKQWYLNSDDSYTYYGFLYDSSSISGTIGQEFEIEIQYSLTEDFKEYISNNYSELSPYIVSEEVTQSTSENCFEDISNLRNNGDYEDYEVLFHNGSSILNPIGFEFNRISAAEQQIHKLELLRTAIQNYDKREDFVQADFELYTTYNNEKISVFSSKLLFGYYVSATSVNSTSITLSSSNFIFA